MCPAGGHHGRKVEVAQEGCWSPSGVRRVLKSERGEEDVYTGDREGSGSNEQ